jgi:hypothetical protein
MTSHIAGLGHGCTLPEARRRERKWGILRGLIKTGDLVKKYPKSCAISNIYIWGGVTIVK